jgi:hypothetical protein
MEKRSPRYDLTFLVQAYPSMRLELDFVGTALVKAGVLKDGSEPWAGTGDAFPREGAWRDLIDDLREVAGL